MPDPATIRVATKADRPNLRAAIVELQEHERRLHATRLPGEQIADAYLDWMHHQAAAAGVVLVAERADHFLGFVAGWIEQTDTIAETADSNRFGYISDICVLPPFRGERVAARLSDAIEQHFRRAGVRRVRVNSLAVNVSARATYEHAGFLPYETLYEKVIAARADA